MPNLNQIFKRQQYRKQQELENRSKEFHIEYKKLVEKFGCDFGAYLALINEGEAVVAKLKVIDATKRIKKEQNEPSS